MRGWYLCFLRPAIRLVTSWVPHETATPALTGSSSRISISTSNPFSISPSVTSSIPSRRRTVSAPSLEFTREHLELRGRLLKGLQYRHSGVNGTAQILAEDLNDPHLIHRGPKSQLNDETPKSFPHCVPR